MADLGLHKNKCKEIKTDERRIRTTKFKQSVEQYLSLRKYTNLGMLITDKYEEEVNI